MQDSLSTDFALIQFFVSVFEVGGVEQTREKEHLLHLSNLLLNALFCAPD